MSEHQVRDDFEQFDADAVCEKCGTVNPEESLICKVCGNNLRDQRQRRIGAASGQPSWGPSGFRIFTGVLTVLGILIVLLAAYSVPTIETWLVDIQTVEEAVDLGQLWELPGSEVYDTLLRNLEESPTPHAQLRGTLDNPVDDDSYNGRYALIRHGGLRGVRVIGEANLRRVGDRVYFVAKLTWRDMEIRGYAMLEEDETGEAIRPYVRNTASVSIDSRHYQGFGYGEKQPDGGQACYGQSFFNDNAYFVSAYRLR